MECLSLLLIKDKFSIYELISVIIDTLEDKEFAYRLSTSGVNWVGVNADVVINTLIRYIESI